MAKGGRILSVATALLLAFASVNVVELSFVFVAVVSSCAEAKAKSVPFCSCVVSHRFPESSRLDTIPIYYHLPFLDLPPQHKGTRT
eukprot:scaffold5959_cov88-Skeletonema_dohrnii-CCMP3373.AAC.4